jgi:ABC-type spermidine/putrescine transport system permease subunit II
LTTSLELFATTALIALLSAVVATILGYPIGNWLAGTGRKTRQLVSAFLLVPFLLPAFLIGITLLPLQPNAFNSITGILWIIGAHVFMNVGFMARVVSANQIPADQMEAASLDGASGLIKRFAIELPQQLAGMLSAGLLVALYSATSYGLVLTLGAGRVDTLETRSESCTGASAVANSADPVFFLPGKINRCRADSVIWRERNSLDWLQTGWGVSGFIIGRDSDRVRRGFCKSRNLWTGSSREFC